MEQAKVDAEKRRAEKLAERERKKAEAERVALEKKRDENLTDRQVRPFSFLRVFFSSLPSARSEIRQRRDPSAA